MFFFFFHFMLFIFILYIILFKSPVCHYLVSHKNLILFSLLYIIIDFVLCINIYASFLLHFVSIKAVFVDFFLHFIFSCFTFGSECSYNILRDIILSSLIKLWRILRRLNALFLTLILIPILSFYFFIIISLFKKF